MCGVKRNQAIVITIIISSYIHVLAYLHLHIVLLTQVVHMWKHADDVACDVPHCIGTALWSTNRSLLVGQLLGWDMDLGRSCNHITAIPITDSNTCISI